MWHSIWKMNYAHSPKPSDQGDGSVINPPTDIDISELMGITLATPWYVFIPPAPKYENKPVFADHSVIFGWGPHTMGGKR